LSYTLDNLTGSSGSIFFLQICRVKQLQMTRKAIIERTVQVINQLPQEKAIEISDFADFLIKKYEEQLINENIQKLVTESKSFSFLYDEEELYSLSDLKEKYNE
jgi:hypothetical protein